jgi:CDP-glycerol glycerophosphotransferase
MVFFTYDLRHYRDDLRGFYFDFEADAPGPLVSSTDAVVEALQDIEGVARAYRQAYNSFRTRFCSLDDGHASARVVSEVFAR